MVSQNSGPADFLPQWITTRGFATYEQVQFLLRHTEGRPRNKLYSFYLPEIQQEVVMKVSHINPRYRLSRKIDLFLTSLYKDYCKIGFCAASMLHSHNLPVARPLAFWTFRKTFSDKKSYFLCARLPGEQSVKQLLHSSETGDFDDGFHTLAEKTVAIIKSVHAAGLRHGDLHLGNIHSHFPRSTPGSKQTKDISDAELFLLDYDNCSKTRIKIPWVKTLYDLKDLSLLTIPTVKDEELLGMYFNTPPTPCSLMAFRFWKNGGCNLRRQLGFKPKRSGRHLAS